MPRRHSPETIQAAVAEHRRGTKSPVICRRYGISERTLYRWLRRADRDAAPHGAEAGALYRTALAVVASGLTDEARDRAVRALGAALNLNRESAERLLARMQVARDD